MDCEKWLRCAEFQNLLDRDNLPCSAEQIANLCGPCPRRAPIRWWANSKVVQVLPKEGRADEN